MLDIEYFLRYVEFHFSTVKSVIHYLIIAVTAIASGCIYGTIAWIKYKGVSKEVHLLREDFGRFINTQRRERKKDRKRIEALEKLCTAQSEKLNLMYDMLKMMNEKGYYGRN